MMQRRNTVNDYPPPTRNMASVPTMDNTFIRRGATAEPFTQPLRQRTTFFRQPVTHVVQLDDHPHQPYTPIVTRIAIPERIRIWLSSGASATMPR